MTGFELTGAGAAGGSSGPVDSASGFVSPPPHAARVNETSAHSANRPIRPRRDLCSSIFGLPRYPSTHKKIRLGRRSFRSLSGVTTARGTPTTHLPATPLSEAHRAEHVLSSRPEALRPRLAAGLPKHRVRVNRLKLQLAICLNSETREICDTKMNAARTAKRCAPRYVRRRFVKSPVTGCSCSRQLRRRFQCRSSCTP
jgi:hypothetical protein